jgi:hypothetical protein
MAATPVQMHHVIPLAAEKLPIIKEPSGIN